MLDLELGLGHFYRTFVELLRNLPLLGGEIDHFLVLERADGDDRQTGIDLHGGDRIAGRGAKEGLLEVRMRDALMRAVSWIWFTIGAEGRACALQLRIADDFPHLLQPV